MYKLIFVFNFKKKLMFVISTKNRLIIAIGADFRTRGSLTKIRGNNTCT